MSKAEANDTEANKEEYGQDYYFCLAAIDALNQIVPFEFLNKYQQSFNILSEDGTTIINFVKHNNFYCSKN